MTAARDALRRIVDLDSPENPDRHRLTITELVNVAREALEEPEPIREKDEAVFLRGWDGGYALAKERAARGVLLEGVKPRWLPAELEAVVLAAEAFLAASPRVGPEGSAEFEDLAQAWDTWDAVTHKVARS